MRKSEEQIDPRDSRALENYTLAQTVGTAPGQNRQWLLLSEADRYLQHRETEESRVHLNRNSSDPNPLEHDFACPLLVPTRGVGGKERPEFHALSERGNFKDFKVQSLSKAQHRKNGPSQDYSPGTRSLIGAPHGTSYPRGYAQLTIHSQLHELAGSGS